MKTLVETSLFDLFASYITVPDLRLVNCLPPMTTLWTALPHFHRKATSWDNYGG